MVQMRDEGHLEAEETGRTWHAHASDRSSKLPEGCDLAYKQ